MSSAAAIVAWLLVRTALRGSVTVSVACVTVVYFVASWARVKRATSEVRLPLMAFFAGLCVTRALEFAWDLPRGRAITAALACAVIGGGAWLASRREREGTALAIGGWALGVAMGELRTATSMLFVLWLARAFARVWSWSERAEWARSARWIAALIALAWAWRGATIGPAALMIGASGIAGGVLATAHREARGEAADVAVFSLAAIALVFVRAWEVCPLVFV
ncbi:MAG: hypothetical protein U0269_13260 [Polyangiales bacterium]